MTVSNLKETAIEYLSENELSYVDMLEPLRRGTADIIYADRDGVVLYEKTSRTCMASMPNLEKCQSVIETEKYHAFAVHQENIAEWIGHRTAFSHRLEAYQAVYRKREPITGCFDRIRLLSSTDTELVCLNYKAAGRSYIESLIDRQQLWGLFESGSPVGFIGEHLEGSMGLLEVLPAFRRKGYGYTLEAFLINRFLRYGRVPFCQVMTDNEASLALQKKLGLDISKSVTIWLYDET